MQRFGSELRAYRMPQGGSPRWQRGRGWGMLCMSCVRSPDSSTGNAMEVAGTPFICSGHCCYCLAVDSAHEPSCQGEPSRHAALAVEGDEQASLQGCFLPLSQELGSCCLGAPMLHYCCAHSGRQRNWQRDWSWWRAVRELPARNYRKDGEVPRGQHCHPGLAAQACGGPSSPCRP